MAEAEGCHTGICCRWLGRCRSVWHADQRGWISCICVILIGVIGLGVMFSFGIFIVALKAEYGTTLMEQNLIAAVPIFMCMFMAPFCVSFIRRMKQYGYRWGSIIGIIIKTVSCISSSFIPGPRWLFLTYSFIFGIGNCLVYMASTLAVADHFDRNHRFYVLATSIAHYPVPLGSLVFNPINAALIAKFQWRTTLRIYSVPLLVLGLFFSWQFVPKSKRNSSETVPLTSTDELCHEHKEETIGFSEYWTFTEMRDRPEIPLWYLGNMFIALGYTLPIFDLPFYMTLRGIPPTESAWILTSMGTAELLTYIVGSFVGDRLKGRLLYADLIASVTLMLLYLITPAAGVYYGSIFVLMIAVAVGNGMAQVYQFPASKEVTGLSSDKAWSCTNFWASFGMIAGPPFFGYIYDKTGNFDNVFYVAGACYCIQTVCFGLIALIKRRRRYHFHDEKMGYAWETSSAESTEVDQSATGYGAAGADDCVCSRSVTD